MRPTVKVPREKVSPGSQAFELEALDWKKKNFCLSDSFELNRSLRYQWSQLVTVESFPLAELRGSSWISSMLFTKYLFKLYIVEQICLYINLFLQVIGAWGGHLSDSRHYFFTSYGCFTGTMQLVI